MDELAWRWLRTGVAGLAAKRDPLRSIVLDQGRLRFFLDDNALDQLDLHSATLLSAAIERQRSLLIGLPDDRPIRPAFLLAYALLNLWWRARSAPGVGRPRLLYCGQSPGIRAQLSKVKVTGLRHPLEAVFDQVDLPKGASSAVESAGGFGLDSPLPRVVTAYSPADPAALIDELRPRCIAVDFGDAAALPWLPELMDRAGKTKTTVLCWGSNPMSDALGAFSRAGHVVRWPFGRGFDEDAQFGLNEPLEVLLQPFTVTQVHPVLVQTKAATSYAEALAHAATVLRAVTGKGVSGYASVALQQHWRLYRDLETLNVPLALYESEAPSFWGLSSIARTLGVCRRFQEILRLRSPAIARELERATDHLAEAIEWLKENDPPLWQALSEIVRTPARQGYARVFTFHSRARKTLFAFSLLARLNLTENDLKANNNWIAALDDFRVGPDQTHGLRSWAEREAVPKALVPIPTVVSPPSIRLNGKLWPIFAPDDIMLLAYDFQHRSLAWRVRTWSEGLSADLGALCATVADLSPILEPKNLPVLTSRVELTAPVRFDGTPAPDAEQTRDVQPLWAGADLQDELSWLFESEDVSDELVGEDASGSSSPSENADPWADEAVEVTFVDGWKGVFERASRVNFVDPQSFHCEERHVSALRPGDRVLIIPFQRRQSLYDLVVSRVHGHPAIQLHLALLDRWHTDLVRGAQEWSRKHKAPSYGIGLADALLREIREKGCSLSSSLAVHFWISRTTLCPNDPEDIRRVADVLSLDFVAANYRRIGQAAARIRGLHRGLANRLNHWLADRARGLAETHDAEVIDPETELRFGDIRASFVVAEVLKVRTVTGPFLRSTLGTISKGSGDGHFALD